MTSSDYYLWVFEKKNSFEIQEIVYAYFEDKTKDHFFKGIELLIKHCKTCIEITVNHIEN